MVTPLDQFSWKRLSPGDALKPFDCADQDLTEFFNEDSPKYGQELLAVTYTFESNEEVIAYYSVSNDRITREDANTRGEVDKLEKPIPHPKRRNSYPAVKVGRLAVNNEHERKGIGSDILNVIKHSFTTGNKTGCRFITVDAYKEDKVINFYKKNGFVFLTKDEEDETRLMYYDLINFKPPE